MAFGITGIFTALLGAYAILKLSLIHFLNNSNIFNFLIFLRLSYCAMMMGFAPQFYTWTTFGFVVLIKTIERLSSLTRFKAVQTS
jgi:hypothetical protein